MSEKTGRNKRRKVMECKHCGHQQAPELAHCENCGYDMGLYGKIVWIDDGSSVVHPAPKPVRWIAVAAAALVLLFLLIPKNPDPDPKPTAAAETQPPATAPTVITEASDPTRETFPVPMTLPEEETLPELTEEAVLQDFSAFADGYIDVAQNYREQLDLRYSWRYYGEEREVMPVFEEYRALLESRLPYSYMNGTTAVTDTYEYVYYWYRYTGPEDVTELTIRTNNEKVPIEDCNIWVVSCKYLQSDNVYIYVGAANEVEYKDLGYRTTCEIPDEDPVPTDISLDVYDILYDMHDKTQADWIPVGFSAGYDVSAASKDQNAIPFRGTVTSSDETVLKVDQANGKIVAVAPGKAVITAAMEGISTSREISVYPVTEMGSTLKVEPSVVRVSGTSPVDAELTFTMEFGENGVQSLERLAERSVISHKGLQNGWTKVADRTYTYRFQITVDPTQVDARSDLGMLVCVLREDENGNKDVSKDIVAYTILAIVKEK